MFDSRHSSLTPMLDKLQLRSTFSDDESQALLDLAVRFERIEPSKYIVREGEVMENCCILLSGSASRHKLTRKGSRQILAVHLRGDLLGLGNALLPIADHSIQVLSRAEVGYITHEAILEVGLAYPIIACALWRETLVEASVAREWIVNVGRRDARERIAHLLCELAVRQGMDSAATPDTIFWPMTQEQVGDATGLTSVHVNRTIQTMRSEGLISTDRQSVTIHDWAALQDVGDFSRGYLHLPKPAGGEMRFKAPGAAQMHAQ